MVLDYEIHPSMATFSSLGLINVINIFLADIFFNNFFPVFLFVCILYMLLDRFELIKKANSMWSFNNFIRSTNEP